MGGDALAALETVLARAGVIDVLLFRRVSPLSWAHLGGVGRGRDWAGVVDLDERDEPLVAGLPEHAGDVRRFVYPAPRRVVGPYYARSGALVRLTNDLLAVLANPTAALTANLSDGELLALSTQVDAVADVSPSKRLADELEVLHAVRAVMSARVGSLPATLDHIVDAAATSLSCEIGILRDGAGRIAFRGGESGRLDDDSDELLAAVNELELLADGDTLCLQQADLRGGLRLVSIEPSIVSILVTPISDPLGGVLIAAHTEAGPRGFTTLCRRVGEQIADAAGVVGHTAALHEELGDLADRHYRAARTDPLTGLGNRLCWEEALAVAQDRVDAGVAMTVITLDLDGLKAVNDTDGHDAGDDLLRSCATLLRDHCGAEDIAVRLGGDEFAVLLPLTSGAAAPRLDHLVGILSGSTGAVPSIVASLGSATALPGQRLIDAVRDADSAMYTQKRSRRSHRPMRA